MVIALDGSYQELTEPEDFEIKFHIELLSFKYMRIINMITWIAVSFCNSSKILKIMIIKFYHTFCTHT